MKRIKRNALWVFAAALLIGAFKWVGLSDVKSNPKQKALADSARKADEETNIRNAIERFRKIHRSYPDSLAQIVTLQWKSISVNELVNGGPFDSSDTETRLSDAESDEEDYSDEEALPLRPDEISRPMVDVFSYAKKSKYEYELNRRK
jgi:hypothetical protein